MESFCTPIRISVQHEPEGDKASDSPVVLRGNRCTGLVADNPLRGNITSTRQKLGAIWVLPVLSFEKLNHSQRDPTQWFGGLPRWNRLRAALLADLWLPRWNREQRSWQICSHLTPTPHALTRSEGASGTEACGRIFKKLNSSTYAPTEKRKRGDGWACAGPVASSL